MRNKKSPLAGGRNNDRQSNNIGIVHPPLEKRKRDCKARAQRRAALRFVCQKIVFYGPPAYRLGRVVLGLKDEVSFFDLDTNTLTELGRAIKEVIE